MHRLKNRGLGVALGCTAVGGLVLAGAAVTGRPDAAGGRRRV